MTRYEIKTDRRVKDRRECKKWPAIKFWCFSIKKQKRRYQRRFTQWQKIDVDTGHYIVYR